VWREDDDNEEDDKDEYFSTPKRNKPDLDLVFGAELGDANAIMDNDNDANANANKDQSPSTKYGMMNKADWSMHVGGGGQPIYPVPYTREAKLFGINLEDGNLEKMRDAHGTIRFHLVFDWLLPLIGKGGFYRLHAKLHDPDHEGMRIPARALQSV
jgi:hypothetical protein